MLPTNVRKTSLHSHREDSEAHQVLEDVPLMLELNETQLSTKVALSLWKSKWDSPICKEPRIMATAAQSKTNQAMRKEPLQVKSKELMRQAKAGVTRLSNLKSYQHAT